MLRRKWRPTRRAPASRFGTTCTDRPLVSCVLVMIALYPAPVCLSTAFETEKRRPDINNCEKGKGKVTSFCARYIAPAGAGRLGPYLSKTCPTNGTKGKRSDVVVVIIERRSLYFALVRPSFFYFFFFFFWFILFIYPRSLFVVRALEDSRARI